MILGEKSFKDCRSWWGNFCFKNMNRSEGVGFSSSIYFGDGSRGCYLFWGGTSDGLCFGEFLFLFTIGQGVGADNGTNGLGQSILISLMKTPFIHIKNSEFLFFTYRHQLFI